MRTTFRSQRHTRRRARDQETRILITGVVKSIEAPAHKRVIDRAYWQQTLTGAPALLTLPTDRPRPAVQDYAGDVVALELDATLTAGLKALRSTSATSR